MPTPTDVHNMHLSLTRTIEEIDDHISKLEAELGHFKSLREHVSTMRSALDATQHPLFTDRVRDTRRRLDMDDEAEVEAVDTRRIAEKLAPTGGK